MNKRITLSKAIEGYLLSAKARHLSQNTMNDYLNTYRKLNIFLDDDPPIEDITVKQIENFLGSQTVSNKTILNYHTGLSALWTWAFSNNIVEQHILHKIKRPKPEKRSITPYTEEDIRGMLAAVNHTNVYSRPGKTESQHSIPTSERNRAIIFVLLDTGIRASELTELKIHHIDLGNRRLKVFGKGNKERTIPISARTGQAIWRYLATRKDEPVDRFLFATSNDGPINRHDLRKLLVRIGSRAGVSKVNVHRFRHTFAINYLRNGGNPWSLQMILGHSTMEMVKTYLALAQADLEKNHKIASPVDNWRL